MLDGMPGVKVKDQFERRRNWRSRDEFGRLWESTVDVESGGPCAPINPRGWHDRLGMPQKYLVKSLTTDPETGNLGIRVMTGLELWASDLEQAHKEYDQRLYNDALTLFGEGGPKAYEDKIPALLNYTGSAPQPLEPVLAAIEGDQWALGLSDKDVNNLQRFYPKQETVREKFLRSLRERDEVDRAVEMDEAHDPDATGGKREKVRRSSKTAA